MGKRICSREQCVVVSLLLLMMDHSSNRLLSDTKIYSSSINCSTALICPCQEDPFVFFWNDDEPGTGIYSQWYAAAFADASFAYSSCEQFMMAAKARLFQVSIILSFCAPRIAACTLAHSVMWTFHIFTLTRTVHAGSPSWGTPIQPRSRSLVARSPSVYL